MTATLRHLKLVIDNVGRIASRVPRGVSIKPKSRMHATQNSLPRLPVAPLEQTLQKYLRVVQPLVDDDDYKRTKKIVEEFQKSPGPQLQEILQKRANERINWLSDWWRDVAYLNFRAPVIINSNPAIVFPKRNYTDKSGQLRYAAKVVAAVLDFKTMLDENRLTVQMLGGKPVCMAQYSNIFGACRIPGVDTDTCVIHRSTEPNPPRHITVMHNNQMFSLDVYGHDNRPLNEKQLYQQMEKIVAMSPDPAPPIGVLTTQDRTIWANTYKTFTQDMANQAAMTDLQRSLAVLCLDGPSDLSENEDEAISHAVSQMLHGVGKLSNAGNRWFDKTMQFIVGENGVSGMNFEHTTADGPPLVDIIDHISAYCDRNVEMGVEAEGITEPRKMTLTFCDKVLKDMEEAEEHLDRLAKDVDFTRFSYPVYGKEFPKSHGLSPDGYIQTVLQLAYYKLYGKPCATYESGSLRRFQLGRTDTIRSCSIDSHNFTKAMTDSSSSRKEKADLFRKAVMAHRKYTDEVVNGNGIDRHLLGWKLAAMEAGLDVPDLYKDPTFSKAFHFNLSTSQLVIRCNATVMFGAVVPDGYGVFYTLKKDSILFSLSAYYSCPQTDTKRLVTALWDSLDDIHELLGPPNAKL